MGTQMYKSIIPSDESKNVLLKLRSRLSKLVTENKDIEDIELIEAANANIKDIVTKLNKKKEGDKSPQSHNKEFDKKSLESNSTEKRLRRGLMERNLNNNRTSSRPTSPTGITNR